MHAELGADIVDRIVIEAGESAAAKFVWPPENADQTQFLWRVFQFFNGSRRILQRQKHNAVEALAVMIAVIRQPGVVSPANRGAQLRVDIVPPRNVKTDGSEQGQTSMPSRSISRRLDAGSNLFA